MLCRRLLSRRTVLAASGAAALIYQQQRHGALAQSDSRDFSLVGLWGQALDGMMDVPGAEDLSSPDGVLYLAPCPAGKPPPPAKWPKLFAKGVIFSLTAHNPMGQDAPPEWNRRANEALEADIGKLQNGRGCAPRAWWRSFGFNAQEDWREDGYSLAFATEERLYARQAVLKLAHKYRQAAIYAYTYDGGIVTREVIWVEPSKHQDLGAKEQMMVVPQAPTTRLAARGYAREEDGSQRSQAPPPPSFAPTGRDTSIWISPRAVYDEVKGWMGK